MFKLPADPKTGTECGGGDGASSSGRGGGGDGAGRHEPASKRRRVPVLPAQAMGAMLMAKLKPKLKPKLKKAPVKPDSKNSGTRLKDRLANDVGGARLPTLSRWKSTAIE